jgi:hypothetical protein
MRSLFLLACLVLGSACDTNLINNPSFDRWCGDHLCDWTTDQGEIARVGSWHERDYAVSFVTKGTQISQVSRSTAPDSCIRFDMIAEVDPESELALLVDFDDNGSVDERQLVPSASWQTTSILIHTPRTYNKVRYIFQKAGEGRAILAQVWADLGCGE